MQVPGLCFSTQYFQVLNMKKLFVPVVHFNKTDLKKSKALSRQNNFSLTFLSHVLVRGRKNVSKLWERFSRETY